MKRSLSLALALLLSMPVVFGQTRLTGADLGGAVRDESGAVITNATVTAASHATAVARRASTDGHGRFIIPGLAPGGYQVTIEKSGFAKRAYETIDLALGQSLDLDVVLRIAGLEEAVTVTADPPLAATRGTAVSEVVSQRQIENLPINGRNFISFAVITPGVAQDNTPNQGAIMTSGLTFAGQRARSNNVMVDGLDNNDLAVGAVRAVFSQEAVLEFQVIVNSFSAEFGKASGGVVNIVTKSGGNEVHGNVFGYFRDKALNAEDHFDKVDVFGTPIDRDKAPFRQGQYGATLGGPIKKQRTFFFLSFERLDETANNFVTIDAAAAATLTGLGFPMTPGPNGYNVTRTQMFGKVDHQWNSNSNVTARANVSDLANGNIETFGGLVARSRGAEQLAKDYSVSASQTNVIRSRWLNEARIQFARQNQLVRSLDPNCGGPCNGIDQGGPAINVTGVASAGRQMFTPNLRIPDRIQVLDTVSYFRGHHQIKGGVDFSHISSEYKVPLQFGGMFVFPNMAAVLAGTPALYVQGYGNDSAPFTYKDVSIFVEDEWRTSKRLTIGAGLRYQSQFFSNIQYDVSNLNGARFQYPLRQPRNDWAPRLSLAFDPGGNGRTTFHAAYGKFYDNQQTGYLDGTTLSNGSNRRMLSMGGAVAQAAWAAPGHQLTESQAISILGRPFSSVTTSADPNRTTPYSHQVSVGVRRSIGDGVVLTLNGLYVHGERQPTQLDYNPIIPALGVGRRPNDINGVAGTSASILQFTNYAENWYRGLTLALHKTLKNRGQFLVSYTWSRSEDNSTDYNNVPQSMGFGRNPADPFGFPLGFDPSPDRGPSVWDQRHRLTVSGLVALPGSFQVSAIVAAASGRPFTALAGVDFNGDGNAGQPPTDRARGNLADIATSAGRNSERFPPQVTVDLRLSRTFRREGKRLKLEPMLEVFNLFNRANYTDVNNIFGPGSFPNNPAVDSQGRVTYGRFTQAQAPRQVQLAVKVTF